MAKDAPTITIDKLLARVEELETLLKSRPAKQGIADDRYWRWWAKVETALKT